MTDSLSFERYSESVRHFWGLPVNFAPVTAQTPRAVGNALVRSLPTVSVARFSGFAHSARHPVTGASGEVFAVNLLLHGEGVFEEGPRFGRLRSMDLVLTDTLRGASWAFSDGFDEFVLRIPVEALSISRGSLDLLRGRVIAPGIHTRFLAKILTDVAEMPDMLVPQAVSGMESTLVALVNGALSENLGGADPGHPVTRDALRSAILDDITLLAADPDLTPAKVAKRRGISVRLLHGLLSETETSFMTELRERRLLKARELIVSGMSVTDSALASGFRRPETFSRLFSARFGITPRDFRRSTLGIS